MGSHVRIVRLQHEHRRRPQQQGLDYTAQITSTISHPFGVPGRELGYCVHHRAPGRVGSTTCIASRHRAFSLLELLLRATAGVVGDGDGWDTMSFYQLSASVRQKAEECEHVQCGHRFGCHHLQQILRDAMANNISDGATLLAKIIVSCAQQRKHCAAAVAHLVADFKARDHFVRELRRYWHMVAYQWCLWVMFQGVQALAIAFNASRVGMPREETLTIAGYRVEMDLAAWFIPQVKVCKTLGGLHRFQHPHVCPEVTYPSVKLFSVRAPAAVERVMKLCVKIA